MKISLKKNALYALFSANLWKNSIFSISILFFNFVAALLEGISYAFILFGFSVLTQDIKSDFLFSRFMFDFFENKTQNQIFVFFILSAIFLQMFRSLFCYLGQLMNSFLLLNIQKEAQAKIYKKIFSLSFSSVSAFKKGDLINYATAPPTFIPSVMDHLNRLFVSVMMILVYIIIMLFISAALTSIIFTLFLLTILLQKLVMKKIGSMSSLQSNHMVELSKQTAQNLEGLKVVHIFDRQKEILRKINFSLNKINKATFKLNKWNYLILPFNEMIGILLVGAALILGLMVLKGEGSLPLIPALLTFLTLTYRLGTYIRLGMISAGEIACKGGAILRLKDILSKENEVFTSCSTKTCTGLHKGIEFKNVSFAHSGSSNYVFRNFSLKIPKGKTVALVGPSGGGKSTLIDLLLRLYDPDTGYIFLDGKKISDYDITSWRKLFGVVTQDTFLFNDTIEENIRFGELKATPKQIMEMAKLAGAHDFISLLPKGYETLIGDRGYRLSGGERQRLSLARCLVRDPQILILDEATSNLDSCSESVIQNTLETFSKEKTLIVVAHRLSTITHADAICVIEKGQIVEKGTHEDLLKREGPYHFYWNLQANSLLNASH